MTPKSWPPVHGDLGDLYSSFAWRTERARFGDISYNMDWKNKVFCHSSVESSNYRSNSASNYSSSGKVLSCS